MKKGIKLASILLTSIILCSCDEGITYYDLYNESNLTSFGEDDEIILTNEISNTLTYLKRVKSYASACVDIKLSYPSDTSTSYYHALEVDVNGYYFEYVNVESQKGNYSYSIALNNSAYYLVFIAQSEEFTNNANFSFAINYSLLREEYELDRLPDSTSIGNKIYEALDLNNQISKYEEILTNRTFSLFERNSEGSHRVTGYRNVDGFVSNEIYESDPDGRLLRADASASLTNGEYSLVRNYKYGVSVPYYFPSDFRVGSFEDYEKALEIIDGLNPQILY